MVPLAVGDLLKRTDRVGKARLLTLLAGEHLGHEERLREEPLHAAGAVHDEFVLLGELVYTEDGDDVLQLAVPLECPLHAAGDLIVPLAHVLRIENAARRGERINGRIDALLRDRTLQVEKRIEVAERRRRGRVGGIVGRHVDRLHRCDRSLGGARDPFLKRPHFRGQCGLITHGARHAAEQRADLAARLREAEDVVNEQQRVGSGRGRIAEVFRHGEGGKRDPQTGSRRLVHLPKHHAGLVDDAPTCVADLGLLHLEPQVGSLAGSLPHAGKHRVATLSTGGDPGDQFGQDHGLAKARTAEQASLPAADERRQQIDHLDAGLEELRLRGEFDHRRRIAMD